MFRKKKDPTIATPLVVALFRAVHCVLFCYALAIVGITFLLHESTTGTLLTPERTFSLVVAAPMLLCSFFFWLAVTGRMLFGSSIFLCILAALLLMMLPAMMNVFFPVHLYLFCLAAVYGVSGIALARYYFAQPVQRTKWDDQKK